MKRKPVVPRELANTDVDEHIAHYLVEATEHKWRVLHDQRDIPAWMTLSDTDI